MKQSHFNHTSTISSYKWRNKGVKTSSCSISRKDYQARIIIRHKNNTMYWAGCSLMAAWRYCYVWARDPGLWLSKVTGTDFHSYSKQLQNWTKYMEQFFSDIAQQAVLDFWLLREGIQMRKPYDDSDFWFVDTFCPQQKRWPKEEEPTHSMMVLLSWVGNLSAGSLNNWNFGGRILKKRELRREQALS